MNLNAVKQLVELLEGSSLAALTYEDGEFKLALSKATSVETSFSSTARVTEVTTNVTSESPVSSNSDTNLVTVTAPVVGTAYRAREPGKSPLVSVGDYINKGDALCVIEAMKIFSEIPAPCSGVVVEVIFEDGQLAEFGAKLIVIEPGESK